MHEACKKLWRAVLRQALRDAGGAMFRETALGWIRAESHQVGSFLWVCMLLEIEPGRIRRKFVKKEKQEPGLDVARSPHGRFIATVLRAVASDLPNTPRSVRIAFHNTSYGSRLLGFLSVSRNGLPARPKILGGVELGPSPQSASRRGSDLLALSSGALDICRTWALLNSRGSGEPGSKSLSLRCAPSFKCLKSSDPSLTRTPIPCRDRSHTLQRYSSGEVSN